MNTAVINIKTEQELKKEAQNIAYDLGMSLSSLINAYLRQLVRTRKIEFDLREEPSEYLIQALSESRKNIRAGRVSPQFKTAEDAIKWLNNPKARYRNGDKV